MNEKAYPQVPTQSPIQRKEPLVKTTLGTILIALTLLALFTTANANGDPDPLGSLVYNVASNYYDGDIDAAMTALSIPTDTLDSLVANVAGNYYDGDIDAAWLAVTGTQREGPTGPTVSEIMSLVQSVANNYYDGNVGAAYSALSAAFESDEMRSRIVAGLSGR